MKECKTRRWLIDARHKKGLTQQSVAQILDISRTSYARYEAGMRTPNPNLADRIARLLDVKREHFFWSF